MSISFSPASLLATVFFGCSILVNAQTALPLPGCETAPEVSKILNEKLDANALDKMKVPQRLALNRQVLEDLIARYPREIEPYQRYLDETRSEDPDEHDALLARMAKIAKDRPDDPLALLLAGWALRDKNTPESVRLLEAALDKAPNFPWPHRELATVYFSGKIADQNKVKEHLEAFFALCPASVDRRVHFLLAKDTALQPKVAVALRARLEKDTDPKRLKDYATLWGLEFRTRPPAEHDALRAQIAQDLKRLEKLNPKGDAEWQEFLINGYKQSGASKEVIDTKKDRLLRDYPQSSEAYEVVTDRWNDAHKEPPDQNDAPAWAKYQKEYKEALKGWIRDYPDDTRNLWFYAIENDHDISEADGIAALDAHLQSFKDFEPQSFRFGNYWSAAGFLIDHGWQPERSLELLKEARAQLDRDRARQKDDDDLTDDDVKTRKTQAIYFDQALNGLTLKVARQEGQPEEALKLKAALEVPPPEDKRVQSGYWANRARLEALQGHTQDALAYYQLALQTRVAPVNAWHGELRDDLTDEARALWKAQGGTEAAWAVWSKPPGATEARAEGYWEKPNKTLPTFELSDLSGKTWRLKEMEGKTVLISVWATWCGPCQAELPELEKFFQKMKGRSDIQVLTFDIDEDLGLVAPYLKEKGYTFPVLPAFSTVVTLLDGFAIPQNWLVDPHGIWRWQQIGYGGGTEADFEKEILAHMDSTKDSTKTVQ